MKTILRQIGINYLALYLSFNIYPGFSVKNSFQVILTASILWLLLNKVVKPIIKLLLLPINLITLGLFSWVISVVTLFLLQFLIVGISLQPHYFTGFTYQGFIIPAFHINLLFSYIITSSLINGIHSIISWLFKK
ncbi:phage holin family protein [Patescibacteria group bacterium]|nr:phage holin family protein [Patescibacteria group bacterium]MBU1256472.1 phage holin family protein [Patescibacteria group bacterium]MBU1457566.1 phage holin family protein [Patescibacteria group bacterium]